jgi:hypothetical protein
MVYARLAVVVVILATMSIAPLLWGDSQATRGVGPAYASALSADNDNGNANGNGNDNGNANDNEDNGNDNEDNGNDNDEVACYQSLNSNVEVPCDFDNSDGEMASTPGGTQTGAAGGGPVGIASGAVFPTVRCYDRGMVGAINLSLARSVVTLDVVPASSFGQISELSLSAVDPATMPAPPGPVLGELMFDVQALNGCGGTEIGQTPSPVNLGVAYELGADKSSLQIARWDGSTWVDVQTVPDPSPSNPYISATIQETGVYTVYEAQ